MNKNKIGFKIDLQVTCIVTIIMMIIIGILFLLWTTFDFIPSLKNMSQVIYPIFIGIALVPLMIYTFLYRKNSILLLKHKYAFAELISILLIIWFSLAGIHLIKNVNKDLKNKIETCRKQNFKGVAFISGNGYICSNGEIIDGCLQTKEYGEICFNFLFESINDENATSTPSADPYETASPAH
jgi:hypothetical protein